MENKLQYEEIEKAIVDQLSNSSLNKDQLSNISKSIASLHKSGFQVVDWSIYGKPPFEQFVIDTQLSFEKAGAVSGILGNKIFKEIRIFKKGLPPMPNFFNVQLTLETR